MMNQNFLKKKKKPLYMTNQHTDDIHNPVNYNFMLLPETIITALMF